MFGPLYAAHSRRRLFGAALSSGILVLLAPASAACGVPGAVSAVRPGSAPAGPPEPTPAPALTPPLTYVALGASDATGVGVDNPARDGWVPVFARSLPQPARLVNLGIPGLKLREALGVLLPPALEAQPNLITVWLVVNDVLGGVALDDYVADLDRLLEQLRSGARARVAVGNIPDASESSRYLGLPSVERRALTGLWNAAIGATVRAHDATLVDLFTRWPVALHPEFIGPDGLHPTAAGYRSLAATFLALLREQRIV
ncbi:MAG: hypothetical protein HY332_02220 [Chloroflexi bacterium]|nr:hypothetical protein [Chloroflexota bacterium]